MKTLIIAAAVAFTLAACTVEEVRYVGDLAISIIDYKLNGGGWR